MCHNVVKQLSLRASTICVVIVCKSLTRVCQSGFVIMLLSILHSVPNRIGHKLVNIYYTSGQAEYVILVISKYVFCAFAMSSGSFLAFLVETHIEAGAGGLFKIS